MPESIGARRARKPRGFDASTVLRPFDGRIEFLEIKRDGYRRISGKVRLYSRTDRLVQVHGTLEDPLDVRRNCSWGAVRWRVDGDAAGAERVLLVDKVKFPSDIPHGHFIHRDGPRRLKQWGLLPKLVASNCRTF